MKVLLFTEKKDYIKVISLLCDEIHKGITVEAINEFQLANAATSHSRAVLMIDDRLYEKINKDCFEVLEKSKIEVVVLLPNFHNIERYLHLNVLDYFTTPMNWRALDLCIRKLVKKYLTIDLISPKNNKRKFVVKDKSDVYMIPEEDILFFEKDQKTVHIHTRKEMFVCHDSLKAISKHLSESFIRVHTSYIVNFNNASSIVMSGPRKYQIAFEDYDLRANMSRNKAEEILKDTVNHYRLSYIRE